MDQLAELLGTSLTGPSARGSCKAAHVRVGVFRQVAADSRPRRAPSPAPRDLVNDGYAPSQCRHDGPGELAPLTGHGTRAKLKRFEDRRKRP